MRKRMDTEEFAAIVAAPLKADVPLRPDFDARVMAAIADAAMPWYRRPVTLAPMRALAIAAAFGGVMVLAGVGLGRSLAPAAVPAVSAAATTDTLHLVRFVFAAPGASQVSLAGDFNGWSRDATPLVDVDGTGQWSVTIAIPPGRHEYAFVVDGSRWVADPFALRQRDEFGQESSVLRVGSEPVRGA